MQLNAIEEEKQRDREIYLDREMEREVIQPALMVEHKIIPYIAVSDWDSYK
jgi:hypothetical protein